MCDEELSAAFEEDDTEQAFLDEVLQEETFRGDGLEATFEDNNESAF